MILVNSDANPTSRLGGWNCGATFVHVQMLNIRKENKEVCCETLTNEPSGGATSNKCRKGKFKSQLELQTEKAVW